MKTTIRFFYLGFAMMVSSSLVAQSNKNDTDIGIFAGIGSFQMSKARTRYAHDTDPGDSFLPNAHVHGSAGTTKLTGENHYWDIGLYYRRRISSNWMWDVNIGYMRLDKKGDGRRNANWIHSPYPSSFIYEQSSPWGTVGGAEVEYRLNKFLSIGLKTQAICLEIDSGSVRADRQTRKYEANPTNKSIETMFSGGPEVSLHIWRFSLIESILMGVNGGVEPNLELRFRI
jgi:hypothetical protein